jgi:hypothetical protein
MRHKNAARHDLNRFLANPEKVRRERALAQARYRQKLQAQGLRANHGERIDTRRARESEQRFRWFWRRREGTRGLTIVGYAAMENPEFVFVYRGIRNRERLRDPLPVS